MNELVPFSGSQAVGSASSGIVVPAMIADAGAQATRRFLEFFAATIRNKNTRMAEWHFLKAEKMVRLEVRQTNASLIGSSDMEPK